MKHQRMIMHSIHVASLHDRSAPPWPRLRAVDTHGSVVGPPTRSASRPSAVSQQIKRLEQQTGVPLLERVGRGVMLTGNGRHLVDEGARLLADLEQVEAGLHRAAGTVAGHLRVTAFSTAMRGLVAPAVRDLREAHPDLTLTLTEREPWDTVDLVAIGPERPRRGAQLGRRTDRDPGAPRHHVPSPHDVADVVVHAGHRLAGRSRVSPRDLVDEGWIATPDGTICRQWLTRMYDGTGRLPRIAHQSMEFGSHLALVEAGLGIALVPRLGRQPLADELVALLAHDPVPTREIVAVHRRSMTDSPAVAAVLRGLTGRDG